MSSHTFYLEDLVIGGSLESLLYCYLTETKLVIDVPRRPVDVDFVNPDLDFSFLGYRPEEKIYSLRLWERLAFLLSMGGYILFPNNIETIRHDENKITVVTHNMKRILIETNKLRSFDKNLTNQCWLYDWFAVRSGGKHDYEQLEDAPGLASRLIFYPSNRIGVRGTKDVLAVSYVEKQHAFEMEYSQAYVRLKTKNMMKQAGITGQSNGYTSTGVRRYKQIDIEHLHRDVQEQTIPLMTTSEILDIPINTKSALCKMTKNLFKPQTRFTWRD